MGYESPIYRGFEGMRFPNVSELTNSDSNWTRQIQSCEQALTEFKAVLHCAIFHTICNLLWNGQNHREASPAIVAESRHTVV